MADDPHDPYDGLPIVFHSPLYGAAYIPVPAVDRHREHVRS